MVLKIYEKLLLLSFMPFTFGGGEIRLKIILVSKDPR